MKENIYKFLKNKRKASLIKESDMSTEITVKEIKMSNNTIQSDKLIINNIHSDELSLRDRVLSFTPVSSTSLYSTETNYHCLLPKKYLKLTKIFRVMMTIQKYNTNRGLSNIFIKCKKCIEDVLKIRVNISDIEKIRFLIPEKITVKIIELEGEKTFTYKLLCTPEEFNKIVWDYYKLKNKKEECRVNEDVEDVERLEILKEDDVKILALERITKQKEGYKIKENLGPEKITEQKENVNNKLEVEIQTKKKYFSILDRIREKERLRKESFIKKAKDEDNSVFLRKLDLYLKKDDKKCVKLKELIKVFNLYDGDRYIRKVVEQEKAYDIKEIFGDEYLIKLI